VARGVVRLNDISSEGKDLGEQFRLGQIPHFALPRRIRRLLSMETFQHKDYK